MPDLVSVSATDLAQVAAEPPRHEPPDTDACGDEFVDDHAVCVCQLPEGHDTSTDHWHDCVCGQTWHVAYAPLDTLHSSKENADA